MILDQNLISLGGPIVGRVAMGFATGYALKKIMKLAFIAISLLMLVTGYLEYQKWIIVNWAIAENQTSAFMMHAVNKAVIITQHINHEIPIGMGVLGFTPGMVLGFMKG